MARKGMLMTVSLPPELYRKALGVARREIRSKSELVREALREYVSRRESVLAARRELTRAMDRAGVKTLRDIERVVDAGRS